MLVPRATLLSKLVSSYNVKWSDVKDGKASVFGVNKKTPANYKPNTDCLMGRKNYGASDKPAQASTIPNVRPRDNTMINNGINHQRMMHNANYQQQRQMQYQSMQLQQRQHVNSQQSQRYQQQFYNQ